MPSIHETVRQRAAARCEYCKAPEVVAGYAFHLEHIRPRAKGGSNALTNYALSCASCNQFKSDHTTGTDPRTRRTERLFNPRLDNWSEHFVFSRNKLRIRGKTPIGRATENRLQLNNKRQIEARALWVQLKLYP